MRLCAAAELVDGGIDEAGADLDGGAAGAAGDDLERTEEAAGFAEEGMRGGIFSRRPGGAAEGGFGERALCEADKFAAEDLHESGVLCFC